MKKVQALSEISALGGIVRFSRRLHGQNKISRQLEAEPAACHARSDFEKIGRDALVKPSPAFLADNGLESIPNRLVLVAHATHGVDLESAAEHIAATVSGSRSDQVEHSQRIGASLGDGARYCTGR